MNYSAVVSVDSFSAKPFISIFYTKLNFPTCYVESWQYQKSSATVMVDNRDQLSYVQKILKTAQIT
jgi:hypothetical protein